MASDKRLQALAIEVEENITLHVVFEEYVPKARNQNVKCDASPPSEIHYFTNLIAMPQGKVLFHMKEVVVAHERGENDREDTYHYN